MLPSAAAWRSLVGVVVANWGTFGKLLGRSYLSGVFGSCPDVTSSSSGTTRDEDWNAQGSFVTIYGHGFSVAALQTSPVRLTGITSDEGWVGMRRRLPCSCINRQEALADGHIAHRLRTCTNTLLKWNTKRPRSI